MPGRDLFDLPVTTGSEAARDAYDTAISMFLGAEPGIEDAFDVALSHDPSLALAHVGLARNAALYGRRDEIKRHMDAAAAKADGLSAREQGHTHFHQLLLSGDGAAAFAFASDQHLVEFPRDALVAQASSGVFGLIGFSGRPARKAENLAFMTGLEAQAKNDWWFQAQLGFAQLETGLFAPAEANLERAHATRPQSAHVAHVRAHLMYETGQNGQGRRTLDDWMVDYTPDGSMFCHNSWHQSLWALLDGDTNAAWRFYEKSIQPGTHVSPPLMAMTDSAAFLFRAALAGHKVDRERWNEISDFADQCFGKAGIAFADYHAALAHAMADRNDRLESLTASAKGPVAELVRLAAIAFGSMAQQSWDEALAAFEDILPSHERFGGSNAQRDLLELATVYVLLKSGRSDEALRMINRRRPGVAAARLIDGL